MHFVYSYQKIRNPASTWTGCRWICSGSAAGRFLGVRRPPSGLGPVRRPGPDHAAGACRGLPGASPKFPGPFILHARSIFPAAWAILHTRSVLRGQPISASARPPYFLCLMLGGRRSRAHTYKKYFLFDAPGPMPESKPRCDNAGFRKYFCDFCAKTTVYTNHAIRYTQYGRTSAIYRQIKNRRTTSRITRAAHPLRSSATTPLRPLCKGHICPLQTEPARSAGRNGNRKRNRKRNRNWNWNKEISLSAPDFPYRRFLHEIFCINAFCTENFIPTLSAQNFYNGPKLHRIFGTGISAPGF